MQRVTAWLAGLCLFLCFAAAAAEEHNGHWSDGLDGTIYLGLGKGYQRTLVPGLEKELDQGLLLVLTGDLRWGNFFIETPIHRSGSYIYSASIGYRFYQHQAHSWDFIASNYNIWLPENKPSSASPQLDGLATRYGDTVQSFRYQYQYRQHMFGVEAGIDLVRHRGAIARLSYSYLLPWRNLDLYLNTAMTFESAKVVDYYYGVRPEEVRADRPQYSADAGVKNHLGITAIYPLAENWQVDGSIGVNLFSHSYLDSPLVTRSHEQVAIVMVRYVF